MSEKVNDEKVYPAPPPTKEEIWCSAPIAAGVGAAFYEFFRKDGVKGVGLGKIALDCSDVDELFFTAICVASEEGGDDHFRPVALVVTPTISERIWPTEDNGEEGEDTEDADEAISWMSQHLLAKLDSAEDADNILRETLGGLVDLRNILQSVGEKAENVSDAADDIVKTGKDIADLLH